MFPQLFVLAFFCYFCWFKIEIPIGLNKINTENILQIVLSVSMFYNAEPKVQ